MKSMKSHLLGLLLVTLFNTSLLVVTLLDSWENDTKKAEEKTANEKIASNKVPKFNSVKEMLYDVGDFNEDTGTLKLVDENPQNPHIQVSTPIVKGKIDKVANRIVKRDILYAAFQIFAQTPTEKITITSIPVDLEDKTKYYDKYKKTVTINKKTTDEIMKEEFGSDDYSILFTRIGYMQVPSKELDRLKVDETFKKLKYRSPCR